MDNQKKIDYIKNYMQLLQDFICPDYPELGIYSHQYSLQIPFNIYSNVPKDELFCYSYMDFDKLSVINEQHGKEKGDIALYTALKIIKNFLPEHASMGRIGGDEFYIITPGVTKLEADELYSKIGVSLDYYRSKIYGLTVTLETECSLMKDGDIISNASFETLQKVTESRVSARKAQNKKDVEVIDIFGNDMKLSVPKNISDEQKRNWETLNSLISSAVKNHLRDLRPSKEFRYDNKQIQAEALSVISALNELIELHVKDEDITPSSLNFSISSENAKFIDDLFINPNMDLSNLSTEQIDSLQKSVKDFSNVLIRDCNSGLLSKSYYNLFLADKLEKSSSDYQCVYFSLSGIRPSNSANGHNFTDMRIQRTAQKLINTFSRKRKFNDNAFSFDANDIFLTDQGGGNYLAIIPKSQALSEEEINEIVDELNSSVDMQKPDSTFLIASSHANDVNISTIPTLLSEDENASTKKPFVKLARHIKEMCNIKKDELKELILSGSDNEVAFRKDLAQMAFFYTHNIENADSINTKKILLSNIFKSLVNHEIFHNKELDDELGDISH